MSRGPRAKARGHKAELASSRTFSAACARVLCSFYGHRMIRCSPLCFNFVPDIYGALHFRFLVDMEANLGAGRVLDGIELPLNLQQFAFDKRPRYLLLRALGGLSSGSGSHALAFRSLAAGDIFVAAWLVTGSGHALALRALLTAGEVFVAAWLVTGSGHALALRALLGAGEIFVAARR
jgi:hypothetical protein